MSTVEGKAEHTNAGQREAEEDTVGKGLRVSFRGWSTTEQNDDDELMEWKMRVLNSCALKTDENEDSDGADVEWKAKELFSRWL